MKRRLLLLTLLFVTCLSYSQTKEERQAMLDAKKQGKNYIYTPEESKYGSSYALVLAHGKFLSKKVTITIDYGQRTKYFQNNTEKDEQGKAIVFNSVVDALNYMRYKGWSFVDAYAITIGNQNVYHYLFEKENETSIPE